VSLFYLSVDLFAHTIPFDLTGFLAFRSLISIWELIFETFLLINVFSFISQYIIPGAAASLERIYANDDQLVMLYEDGRARLWDVSVGEFRRSAVKDKVPEMIGEGPVMWYVILMTKHHALKYAGC
jgi:hypothetical protein